MGWWCPLDAYNKSSLSIYHQSNASLSHLTVKKWNTDFHRHPTLVRTNTPFSPHCNSDVFSVSEQKYELHISSFTQPHSLMPLIISEVSPESSSFFLFPLNERTVRFSPLSSTSLIPSSNTHTHTLFNGIQMVILATQPSFDSPPCQNHHRRKLPDYSILRERGGWNEIWDLYRVSLLNLGAIKQACGW